MDSQTRREGRRSKSYNSSQTSTLLVQSLATETTTLDLYKIFDAFEGFAAARIIYDPQTKTSQGYGYVDLTTPRQAQRVHDLFHNNNVSMYLNERKISVSLALPAAEEERRKNESKAQKLMEILDDSTPGEAVRKRTKREFNAVAIQDDYERFVHPSKSHEDGVIVIYWLITTQGFQRSRRGLCASCSACSERHGGAFYK
jgi:RNA recognition motif-containing protein